MAPSEGIVVEDMAVLDAVLSEVGVNVAEDAD
jgi:hypothetical protein